MTLDEKYTIKHTTAICHYDNWGPIFGVSGTNDMGIINRAHEK